MTSEICFNCMELDVESTNSIDNADILYFIRRYLTLKSSNEGVPAGVFLTPKRFAGTIKKDWNAVPSLGKVGYKRVQVVDGLPEYCIIRRVE